MMKIEVRQESEWNVVGITDNGSGIDKKTMRKIFNPFYSTKTNVRNLGIGLSYASTITKMHFGLMHVQSTVGSHTTFQVALPKYAMGGKNG